MISLAFGFIILACFVWTSYGSGSGSITASYIGHSAYDPNTQSILDITEDEISGLVWFDNNVFYAISDNLVSNKGWIKYEYNSNDFSFTTIGGELLGEHPWGDTSATDAEQIAVLGLAFEDGYYDDGTSNTPINILGCKGNKNIYGYFVISKEGWRPLNRDDRILLYNMNGNYIKELSFPSLFTMTDTTGMKNNGGFEALYISDNYETMVIINELPLLQDECIDDKSCVRVSIGNINSKTASSIDDIDVTYNYMLRYDATSLDWEVKDILLLNDDECSNNQYRMPALILESYAGSDGVTRDFDIFLVDLSIQTHGWNQDVSDCFSLSDDCPNIQSINKISIFEDGIKLPDNLDFDYTLLNFEAMALYIDDDLNERLILSNDNAEIYENYFIAFEIDYDCRNGNGKSSSSSSSGNGGGKGKNNGKSSSSSSSVSSSSSSHD